MKIPRQKTKVLILTENYKIIGDAYLPVEARLTDFMNSRSDHNFIPVTDAFIYKNSNGKLFMKSKFININTDLVLLVSNESDQI